MINDWRYERPDPTAAYFALKGFKIICPWRFPDVIKNQFQMMVDFRRGATDALKDNYQGMLHTFWTSAENTIDQFYGRQEANNTRRGGNWVEAFRALYDEIEKLDSAN